MLNAEKYRNEIIESLKGRALCYAMAEVAYKHGFKSTLSPYYGDDPNDYNREILNWLLSEYKEQPLLDEVERKYLSKLCEPFTVKKIEKLFDFANNFEWISVVVMRCDNDSLECINLPFFKENTMYKGLKRNKVYIPQQLGIRCKNNPKGEIKN